jgi:acetyltransferase-like isoleucine patch superfamily enzyme
MTERFASRLHRLYSALRRHMKSRHDRHVALGDLCTDRWETARFLGFGEGSSCYDNVLVLGEVKVGRQTWIGPNVVLDGSGGLEIGDYCSISAGVQIYTHHTVAWATSMGQAEVERSPTRIGSGVYVGPNTVIAMGVTIGDRTVIGAMSLVNRDVPSGARAWGVPARFVPPGVPASGASPSPGSGP